MLLNYFDLIILKIFKIIINNVSLVLSLINIKNSILNISLLALLNLLILNVLTLFKKPLLNFKAFYISSFYYYSTLIFYNDPILKILPLSFLKELLLLLENDYLLIY